MSHLILIQCALLDQFTIWCFWWFLPWFLPLSLVFVLSFGKIIICIYFIYFPSFFLFLILCTLLLFLLFSIFSGLLCFYFSFLFWVTTHRDILISLCTLMDPLSMFELISKLIKIKYSKIQIPSFKFNLSQTTIIQNFS